MLMLGAQSAGKTKTSLSLGIDDGVANVFRQGGGSPVARAAIMVCSVEIFFLRKNMLKFSTRVVLGHSPKK